MDGVIILIVGIDLGFDPALTGVLGKYEIRISKSETNTKIQIQMTKTVLTASELGLRANIQVRPYGDNSFLFGFYAFAISSTMKR